MTSHDNNGNISQILQTSSSNEHVTNTFNCFEIENMKFYDTWGWTPSNYKNDEISSIITGKVPVGWDMGKNIFTENLELNQNPTLNDSMHCVILIVNYESYDDVNYYKTFETAKNASNNRGIPFLILLNKCDKHHISLVENPIKIFDSSELYDIKKKFQRKQVLIWVTFCCLKVIPKKVFPLKLLIIYP